MEVIKTYIVTDEQDRLQFLYQLQNESYILQKDDWLLNSPIKVLEFIPKEEALRLIHQVEGN